MRINQQMRLRDAHRNLQLIQPPIGGYTPKFRVDVKDVLVVDFVFCQIRIKYFSILLFITDLNF